MNRILFEKNEIGAEGIVTLDDFRAEHILKVLHSEVGDILKTGEIDGLIGTSEIVAIDDGRVTLRADHGEKGLAPWVDLILAPPRPRALKRLLPQLASLGVGNIVLVGAQKVEKDFWGATLLKEEIYRPLLIDGLMQAGTAALPQIFARRNFRNFIRDELQSLMPSPWRIVAHPYASDETRLPRPDPGGTRLSRLDSGGTRLSCPDSGGTRLSRPDPGGTRLSRPNPGGPQDGVRLTLAVGPEGGWTDREVALLEENGFVRYSLGGRILRTDTALIALIARLAP